MSQTRKISEKDITESLKYADLDTDHLNEIIGAILTLNDAGIIPVKLWPQGQPAIDSVAVTAVLNADQLSALTSQLVDLSAISSVRLNPIGIPDPSQFITEIVLS